MYYALCTPFVKGFCLKEKQWGMHRYRFAQDKIVDICIGVFDISLVKDVEWNEEAFDRLVLPQDYKEIIWAFVDAKMSGLDNFDDVIRGKGNCHYP